METWRCVKNCGACCNLDPVDRPDLEDYLSQEDLALYLSMVGEGGWCIHYDRATRECSIYDRRPVFCRVEPDNFKKMYDIDNEEFNEFAIDCCRQHIEGVYGSKSEEMINYNNRIKNN